MPPLVRVPRGTSFASACFSFFVFSKTGPLRAFFNNLERVVLAIISFRLRRLLAPKISEFIYLAQYAASGVVSRNSYSYHFKTLIFSYLQNYLHQLKITGSGTQRIELTPRARARVICSGSSVADQVWPSALNIYRYTFLISEYKLRMG